ISGTNNVYIGNAGSGNESGTIRIGTSQTKATMAGISGGNIAASSGLVCVDSSGLLGTVPSGGAVFPGDLQIGTSAGDYHHVTLGGGNALGFLYGSYLNQNLDNINLSYNFYADAAGIGHAPNAGGATSRVAVGFGTVTLLVSLVAGA